MANDAGTILKLIEEKEIEWVDLRFTDPKGKWQHLSMCASAIDEDGLTDGLMFDGSSIAGWKAKSAFRAPSPCCCACWSPPAAEISDHPPR